MAIKTHLVRGQASWCKIIGAAPPGYDNGPAEWSFDLILDEEGKKTFLASGADKFYVKNRDGKDFVRFVRKAVKQDGEAAQPIRVVDHRGQPWDGKTLIGNGSTLNVNFTLNEVKSKGVKRLKPSVLSVQVWDLKKYQGKSEFPVKDEPAAAVEAEWDGN